MTPMIMDHKCPQCDGDGFVVVRRVLIGTRIQVFEETCPSCDGTGLVGDGLIEEEEDYEDDHL